MLASMAKRFDIWVKNDETGEPRIFLEDPDAPPPPPPRRQYRGANLTGGGTSWRGWMKPPTGTAPGPVSGTHYMFIANADAQRLIDAGMRTFRVVFTWEALQPTEYASIGTLSGNFKIYRDKLFALVKYLRDHGCTVLLDIHGDVDAGFAQWMGVSVGQPTPKGQGKIDDLLANLWSQLAKKYLGDEGVMFGVTNEPHDLPAATWFTAAQKVIDAVRATGSTSKIVMPGTDWTGAGSWMKNNAAAWNLTDPLGNLAVQVHMYHDANSGGGQDEIPHENIGVDRLKDVTAWCREKGLELWIGETGVSANNPIAPETWRRTIEFVDKNRDVIAAVIWWAQGPPAWWGGYRFALIDKAGNFTPHFALAKDALVEPVA